MVQVKKDGSYNQVVSVEMGGEESEDFKCFMKVNTTNFLMGWL